MDTVIQKLINKIADLYLENSELRAEIKKLKKISILFFLAASFSLLSIFLFLLMIWNKFL